MNSLLKLAGIFGIGTAGLSAMEFRTVAEGFRDPMEIALAPDGDVWVVEREGRILRVRPATGAVLEVVEIPVTALRQAEANSDWAREDGLMGVTLDPDFARNSRIYLYYSHPEKMVNRLSRFTVREGRWDMASEQVLLDVASDRKDRVCHHGGSLAFGPDGLLYLSTGDNTNPFQSDGYAPIDEREGREHLDASRSAGNTNDLRGKVLRIRPTETGYEIPEGNLFPPGTPETRPEIYVMGCRNPFRISIDPKTKTLYWGEVGPDASNDSDKGPRGYDEVNQAKSAGNHGWPFAIGDSQPYAFRDFVTGKVGAKQNPADPKNRSRNNTGKEDLPPARAALIYYPYAASEKFPEMGNGGRNAMAGPILRFQEGRKFQWKKPEEGTVLLTYDWIRGGIWEAELNDEEELKSLKRVANGLKHPMDLEISADGTLWLLEYGTDWYFNRDGRLRMIRPAGSNREPKVEIVREGDRLTAKASDPEGKAVTVAWWVTEGEEDRKVAEGESVTLPVGEAREIRAVATDADGEVGYARLTLKEMQAMPVLGLKVPSKVSGETLSFEVTGAPKESEVAVRVRFIPATGHDAGGPQLPADLSELVTQRQCLACHQVDQASVGPAYTSVALKYRGDSGALERLVAKLKDGGGGVWGEVPMPPQVALQEGEGEKIVEAVLALAQGMEEVKGRAKGEIRLPAIPEGAAAEGMWEVSASAPGCRSFKTRLPAQ